MAELSYYGVGNQSNWNTPVEPEKPTPQVTQTPLIPPELQSIIDKVSGSSMSVGRKGQQLASLGGVIGGLEQQRRSEQGAMQRMGVSSQLESQKVGIMGGQLGVEERKLGLEQEKFGLEKKLKTQPFPVSASGVQNQPTSSPTEKPAESWWDKYKKLNFVY